MTTPIPALDVCIEYEPWAALEDLEAIIGRSIKAACDYLSERDHFHVPVTSELALLFTSDEAMRTINKEWRDQDKPTNVLSFPALEPQGIEDARSKTSHPVPLGDIVLAFETVEREASDELKTLDAHVSHLLIHGFLHLLGFDHMDEIDAEQMEAREVAILNLLGYPNPYGVFQTPS
jgi:probable rRNA maturation factor